MLIGILIGVALAVAAIAALRLLRDAPSRTRHWVGAIAVSLWVAGAGFKIYLDRAAPENPANAEALLQTMRSVSWLEPTEIGDATAASGEVAAASGVQADPVDSLIGGLEARLSQDPTDAKGWALLAQSYAFVGNTEAAEHAIERAVALGVDETTLRDRVRLATRDTHPANWIEGAIGG